MIIIKKETLFSINIITNSYYNKTLIIKTPSQKMEYRFDNKDININKLYPKNYKEYKYQFNKISKYAELANLRLISMSNKINVYYFTKYKLTLYDNFNKVTIIDDGNGWKVDRPLSKREWKHYYSWVRANLPYIWENDKNLPRVCYESLGISSIDDNGSSVFSYTNEIGNHEIIQAMNKFQAARYFKDMFQDFKWNRIEVIKGIKLIDN